MVDSRDSFEILEDSSGLGVAASSSQEGDSKTNKKGLTVFSFVDGSSNLIMPKNLNSTPALSEYGQITRPIPLELKKYSAAAAGFVLATTPTDVFTITGSATKTIRVNKISVTGRTTSGSPVACIVNLIRRSSADSGGTRVADTVVPFDSTSPAGTATVGHYTANPTLGTTVGKIASKSITFQNIGLSPEGDLMFEFINPLILRGTSEQIAINFNSTSITGSSISCYVEWEEV